MKELLECKDLLKHERVIAAYWGLMGGCTHFLMYGQYVDIPGSLADVAFEMRDALVAADINGEKSCDWDWWLSAVTGNESDCSMRLSDPKQWIIVAVLCQEASK